jgi:hypothetical protein
MEAILVHHAGLFCSCQLLQLLLLEKLAEVQELVDAAVHTGDEWPGHVMIAPSAPYNSPKSNVTACPGKYLGVPAGNLT